VVVRGWLFRRPGAGAANHDRGSGVPGITAGLSILRDQLFSAAKSRVLRSAAAFNAGNTSIRSTSWAVTKRCDLDDGGGIAVRMAASFRSSARVKQHDADGDRMLRLARKPGQWPVLAAPVAPNERFLRSEN